MIPGFNSFSKEVEEDDWENGNLRERAFTNYFYNLGYVTYTVFENNSFIYFSFGMIILAFIVMKII